MTRPKALLTVELVMDFRDGQLPTMKTDTHVWDGYTAQQAADTRHANLKEARADATRTGNTITVRIDKGEWHQTETLTFTDHQPDQGENQ